MLLSIDAHILSIKPKTFYNFKSVDCFIRFIYTRASISKDVQPYCYSLSIMLALCLMLSSTYYAKIMPA